MPQPKKKSPRRPPTARRDDELIDTLQKIRSETNVLWMGIVRLAMKKARREARAIFRQIERNDARQLAAIRKAYGKGG